MDKAASIRLLAGIALATPMIAYGACSVALDVGHSIRKPGATSSRGLKEFEFNLALATKIDHALISKGCTSVLIGSHGDITELTARTAQAGNAGLFLSVHHDSVQSQFLALWSYNGGDQRYSDKFSGFSLFVSRRNSDLQQSIRCASAIGAALREAGFMPSSYHAADVPGERRPFADQKNGVHYYDGLAVLRTASKSAVLLEAGVIVNRDEEAQLSKDEMKEIIAQAVARGVSLCASSKPNMGPLNEKEMTRDRTAG